jgi:hypothetical protein
MADSESDGELNERQIHAMFEAKGLRVELRDGGVLIKNTMTPEEHQAAMASLAEESRAMVQRIPAMTRELETLLLQYNAFDMLATLSVTNLMNDPETYKEYAEASLSIHIEFPTQLYLKWPFSVGNGVPLIPGPVLEQVDNLTRDICSAQLIQWQYQDIDVELEGVDEAVSDLRRRTLSDELVIREKCYPHQLHSVLTELCSPFSDWFVANLGFTLDEMIAVLDGLRDLLHKRVNERRRESGIVMDGLREGLAQLDTGQEITNPAVLPLVQQIANSPEDSEELVLRAGLVQCFWDLGQLVSFSPDDVATETGVAVNHVRACLNYFAQDFGSESTDLLAPRPLLTIRRRPLLHHEGRYLAPNPQLLLPAVQARLEEALKDAGVARDPRVWNKYETHRAAYVEHKVLELLRRILRRTETFHSVKYRFNYEAQEQEFELDGLTLLDDLVFLVEAKAGQFSEPARRGAQKTMVADLKELVAKAFRQGVRANQYIEETANPTFTTETGGTVVIDKSRSTKVFIITVTLDTLSTFTTVLNKTAKLGIFPEGDLPWAVSLGDLMVIADLIELPCQFVHYLRRRQEVNLSDVPFAMDELDWFGKYLFDGLRLQQEGIEDVSRMLLQSYTTEMDEWYRQQMGERQTDSPKPQQQFPEGLRSILFALDEEHSPGYIELSCALLDAFYSDKKAFERKLQDYVRSEDEAILDVATRLLSSSG